MGAGIRLSPEGGMQLSSYTLAADQFDYNWPYARWRSLEVLRMFLQEQDTIPWDALQIIYDMLQVMYNQLQIGHLRGIRCGCRRRWWCNVCSLIVLLIRTIYIMDELGDKRSRKCARRRKGAMK